MNDDNLKPQTPVTPAPIPEYKPKVPVPAVVESSIKPIRTFEKDVALAKGGNREDIKKLEVRSGPVVDTPPAKPPSFLFEKATAMTEDRQKQYEGFVVPKVIPKIEEHPLQMLHNQIDPEKNIRTYEGDAAKSLTDPKASILAMAVAESKRRDGRESVFNTSPSQSSTARSGRKFLFAILSLIFIAAGAMGGYYLYQRSPLASVPIKQEIKITSIVTPDSQKTINIPGSEKTQIITLLSDMFNNTNLDENKILELILTQTIAETTKRMSGSDFINTMQFDITDTLKRSLTDKWMIGIYSQDGENLPFIIFTTDFFQNSFAGMLKWEYTMPNEFGYLWNYHEKISMGNFKDKIIQNRDIREFLNEKGEVLILYTFLDKDTILITTSEAVVGGLIERIEKQTYVR